MNAADLFVSCLEAEGVEYVFGIPGEETLDLNRALDVMPEIDLIGDIERILQRLTEACGDRRETAAAVPSRLRDLVAGRFGGDDDSFPMQPPRLLWEIRAALGRDDILISDVGLHKLWISRMFPAFEPGKTAKRLRTPVVNVIWENAQYGSIVWKQDKKFGRHFGTDFSNPDFVQLAEAFGLAGLRCESVEDFGAHLRRALELDVPSIVVVPVDYSLDIALEELGTETVAA